MIESPAQLMEALRKLPSCVEVEAPAHIWLALIGVAQLGLRHPNMPPSAAESVRHWIENFADNMPADLAAHIRSGFDPACDSPTPKGLIKHG